MSALKRAYSKTPAEHRRDQPPCSSSSTGAYHETIGVLDTPRCANPQLDVYCFLLLRCGGAPKKVDRGQSRCQAERAADR